MSTEKILIGSGLASSILYLVAIDILTPLVLPQHHSYTHQMVSELFAAGSPTRPFLAVPMIIYNLLILAFAAGIWRSANGSRTLKLVAVCLGIYGLISISGFLFAPMDIRGSTGMSQRDMVHIGLTIVQGIVFLLALALSAFTRGYRFRWYSIMTLLTILVFSALAGLFATQTASPWLGISERICIYCWMLWIAVFATTFLHTPATIRKLNQVE